MFSKFSEHVRRFNAGWGSFMSAIGGTVSLVGWGLAGAFAFLENSKTGVAVGAAIGATGVLLVIYDCGRRITRLEELLRPAGKKALLTIALLRLENARREVDAMTAQEYFDGMDEDGSHESIDEQMVGIWATVTEQCGMTEFMLISSTAGMQVTKVDPSHPNYEWERLRQGALDEMNHHAVQLKALISRTE